MVVGTFPILSEFFIINQITGLIDLGHDVDILAFKKSSERAVHEDVLKYKLLERVTYIERVPEFRIQSLWKLTQVIARRFLFHPKAIMAVLNAQRYESRYTTMDNLFKLNCFLDKKYDVVHCHFGPIANQVIFLKDILPKVKFIAQFHGYDISRYVRGKTKSVYK